VYLWKALCRERVGSEMNNPVSRRCSRALLGAFVGMVIGIASSLVAEVAPSPAVEGAPVRGVRLAQVVGSVRLVQANELLTDAAIANTTLYEGTQIAAQSDGRAEIQMEDGSLLRLTPNSTLTLNVLRRQGNDTETEIELNGGLAYFELQSDTDSHKLRVKLGSATITATTFSVLRLNLDRAPGSMAVFSGAAHLERPNGEHPTVAVDVHDGEGLQLSATDATQYNLAEQIEPDSWDAWNTDRDQLLKSQASQRTPATSNVGGADNPAWSDLDANGSWYDVPGEGSVWSPTEAAMGGWDPYGNGAWMWRPQFGYGWVSAEPWGYLPYMCGRWNHYDSFGWGWMPGFGGCDPWFGSGFWSINIGIYPPRYHPPTPPRRGPIGGFGGHPRGVPPPVVVVNRNRPGRGVYTQPRGGVVTISGHSVEPLRPVAPRPIYGLTGASGTIRAGQQAGQQTGQPPIVGTTQRGGVAAPPTSGSGLGLGLRPGYTAPPPGARFPGSTGSVPASPRHSSPAQAYPTQTPPAQARPPGFNSPRPSSGAVGGRSFGGSAPVSRPAPSGGFSGGGGGGGFSGGGGGGGFSGGARSGSVGTRR